MAEIVALAQEYPILSGIWGTTMTGSLASLDYENRRERRRQTNWRRPFENFYATRRPDTQFLRQDQMPVFTQGRKRAAGRQYQNPNAANRKRFKANVCNRMMTRVPRSLPEQRGVV